MGIPLALAQVEIRGDASRFAGDVQAATPAIEGAVGQLAGRVQGVLGAVGLGFGFFQTISSMVQSERMAEESIGTYERLQAMVRSTEMAAGWTAEELKKWAEEMMKLTTFEDEAIMQAATSLMRFRSVGGETFKSVLMAAMNMASTGFGSVQSNAMMLGRALENPTRGAMALYRANVVLDDQEKANIKTLMQSGDVLGAQEVILKAINKVYKDNATEEAKSPLGKLKQTRVALGEIREELGAKLLGVMQKATEAQITFQSVLSRMVGAFQTVNAATNGWLGVMVGVGAALASSIYLLPSFINGLKLLAAGFNAVRLAMVKAFLANPIMWVVVAIATAVAGIAALVAWMSKSTAVQEVWSTVCKNFAVAWERIKAIFEIVKNAILVGLYEVAKWLGGLVGVDVPSLGSSIQEMAANALVAVSNFAMNASEWILAVLMNWKLVWNAMGSLVAAVVSYIGDLIWNYYTVFLPQAVGYGIKKAWDFFVWLLGQVVKWAWELVKIVVSAIANIPKLIWGVLTGTDVLGNIAEGAANAAKSAATAFGKGIRGEAPDLAKVLVPSAGTMEKRREFRKQAGDAIAATKKDLESKRPDLFPKVAGEKGGPKKPGALPSRAGQDIKDVWLSFEDLGKKLQEVLLGRFGGEDKQDVMIDLTKAGNKTQEDLLKAVEKLEPEGGLE